jgi:hypothetical protein
MKKGTVFLHKNFEFANGGIADKYFIVLNNPGPEDPILACRTTSKGQRKPQAPGCHYQKNLFLIEGGYDFFPLRTWVQFNVFEFNLHGLLQLSFEKTVILKTDLRDQTINAIINCLILSDDISQFHLNLIKKK